MSGSAKRQWPKPQAEYSSAARGYQSREGAFIYGRPASELPTLHIVAGPPPGRRLLRSANASTTRVFRLPASANVSTAWGGATEQTPGDATALASASMVELARAAGEASVGTPTVGVPTAFAANGRRLQDTCFDLFCVLKFGARILLTITSVADGAVLLHSAP